MVYRRYYCKFEAEASALAGAFSSDENNVLDDTCNRNNPNVLHNIVENTDPDNLSCDISDSDDDRQTTDSDEHINNIPPLCHPLASWATKNTIWHWPVNELLEIAW